jgi:hypothetical protein
MDFFSRLFKNNKPKDNLSKEEHWKKWEFFELLVDLHDAEEILSKYEGGYSGVFFSAQEFHGALISEIEDLEFGNKPDLTNFWIWFAPTTAWDDFVGKEGVDLGNRIFERVDKWMKGNT